MLMIFENTDNAIIIISNAVHFHLNDVVKKINY